MTSLEKIAKDLQITFIIDDINEYINDHKKLIQIIDDQQLNINSIDELFYHLYHIEKLTVFNVKKFILESEWSSTIEKMQEFHEINDMTNQVFEWRLSCIEGQLNQINDNLKAI